VPKNKSEKRTAMKTIQEINGIDFDKEVLNSNQPVLVNFWAAWSRPCGILGSVLDEISSECNSGVKLLKVNVDDNPDLGLWFGINSIPTLLFFTDGNVAARIVGTASKEAILAKLHSLTS